MDVMKIVGRVIAGKWMQLGMVSKNAASPFVENRSDLYFVIGIGLGSYSLYDASESSKIIDKRLKRIELRTHEIEMMQMAAALRNPSTRLYVLRVLLLEWNEKSPRERERISRMLMMLHGEMDPLEERRLNYLVKKLLNVNVDASVFRFDAMPLFVEDWELMTKEERKSMVDRFPDVMKKKEVPEVVDPAVHSNLMKKNRSLRC